MPLYLFTSPGRFEVQLAVVELDIRTKQVFDQIDNDRFAGEFPESGMQVGGGNKSSEPWGLRAVSCLEIKEGRRLGQGFTLIDKTLGCVLKTLQRPLVDQTGQRDESVSLVGLALVAREHTMRSRIPGYDPRCPCEVQGRSSPTRLFVFPSIHLHQTLGATCELCPRCGRRAATTPCSPRCWDVPPLARTRPGESCARD